MKRMKEEYAEDGFGIDLRQLRFRVAHAAKLLLDGGEVAVGQLQVGASLVDHGNGQLRLAVSHETRVYRKRVHSLLGVQRSDVEKGAHLLHEEALRGDLLLRIHRRVPRDGTANLSMIRQRLTYCVGNDREVLRNGQQSVQVHFSRVETIIVAVLDNITEGFSITHDFLQIGYDSLFIAL